MANPSSDLRIGDRDLAVVLATQIHELTDRVLENLVTEVPAYARLPDELLNRDVRRVVDRAVRIFVEALSSEGRPDPEVLTDLTGSAVRRAEEGVPFEMVLAAYHCGVRVCHDTVLAAAGPGDLAAVLRVNRTCMNFLERVACAVADGYARFTQTTLAEQSAASQALANALVEGTDISDAARRSGVVLPPTYLVVSVVAGTHPDEATPGLDPLVANRRKVRRVREELDRSFPDPVLWIPSPDGGLALIPHGVTPESMDSTDWARLNQVVADVRRAAGAEVHVGAAAARPDDVPTAANLVREIVDLVLALERPEGSYRLQDVALEYHLTRASDARAALASLLEPLAGQDHLVETVRSFLGSGLSRKRTAALLHVHPNTVDNRLHRAAELTGLDASDPADVPTLSAALTAAALAKNL